MDLRNVSISHGTLRWQDLVPAFLNALSDIDEEKFLAVVFPNRMPSGYDFAHEDSDYWHSEDCMLALDDLLNALDECAPEGYVFGAHPGDGSDFGFWPDYTDYYAEAVLN